MLAVRVADSQQGFIIEGPGHVRDHLAFLTVSTNTKTLHSLGFTFLLNQREY